MVQRPSESLSHSTHHTWLTPTLSRTYKSSDLIQFSLSTITTTFTIPFPQPNTPNQNGILLNPNLPPNPLTHHHHHQTPLQPHNTSPIHPNLQPLTLLPKIHVTQFLRARFPRTTTTLQISRPRHQQRSNIFIHLSPASPFHEEPSYEGDPAWGCEDF